MIDLYILVDDEGKIEFISNSLRSTEEVREFLGLVYMAIDKSPMFKTRRLELIKGGKSDEEGSD